jgi:putative transposase
MGRVGSALDNSVIESRHSTVEFELRSLEHFTTKVQARSRHAVWIEDYNGVTLDARKLARLLPLAPQCD